MGRLSNIVLLTVFVILDVIFFTIIRRDFTSAYRFLIPREFEGIVIIIGFLLAILASLAIIELIAGGAQEIPEEMEP